MYADTNPRKSNGEPCCPNCDCHLGCIPPEWAIGYYSVIALGALVESVVLFVKFLDWEKRIALKYTSNFLYICFIIFFIVFLLLLLCILSIFLVKGPSRPKWINYSATLYELYAILNIIIAIIVFFGPIIPKTWETSFTDAISDLIKSSSKEDIKLAYNLSLQLDNVRLICLLKKDRNKEICIQTNLLGIDGANITLMTFITGLVLIISTCCIICIKDDEILSNRDSQSLAITVVERYPVYPTNI